MSFCVTVTVTLKDMLSNTLLYRFRCFLKVIKLSYFSTSSGSAFQITEDLRLKDVLSKFVLHLDTLIFILSRKSLFVVCFSIYLITSC